MTAGKVALYSYSIRFWTGCDPSECFRFFPLLPDTFLAPWKGLTTYHSSSHENLSAKSFWFSLTGSILMRATRTWLLGWDSRSSTAGKCHHTWGSGKCLLDPSLFTSLYTLDSPLFLQPTEPLFTEIGSRFIQEVIHLTLLLCNWSLCAGSINNNALTNLNRWLANLERITFTIVTCSTKSVPLHPILRLSLQWDRLFSGLWPNPILMPFGTKSYCLYKVKCHVYKRCGCHRMMQGWLFKNDRSYWTAELSRALLTSVPLVSWPFLQEIIENLK